MDILWKVLRDTAEVPQYSTDGSGAVDLRYIEDDNTALLPQETLQVRTGLACAIPEGYSGIILPRSGLGIKHGIIIGNTTGFIDSDYRGEIIICLWNRSKNVYIIDPRDRIAQMTFIPTPRFFMKQVDTLPITDRGEKGLGSTGVF